MLERETRDKYKQDESAKECYQILKCSLLGISKYSGSRRPDKKYVVAIAKSKPRLTSISVTQSVLTESHKLFHEVGMRG